MSGVCPPHPQENPEEKGFVVLKSAELDTVKVSQNPTKVVTASGEVQTKEEVTVHLRELELIRDSNAS